MEFLFEVFLQFGLALLATRGDESRYFSKIPRKVRALDVYVPIALILKNKGYISEDDFIAIEVEELITSIEATTELDELVSSLRSYIAKEVNIRPEVREQIKIIEDPALLADMAAIQLRLGWHECQKILELVDLKERLAKILSYLQPNI